jgi:hypothetical protein
MRTRLLSRLVLATVVVIPALVAARPQITPQTASALLATAQWISIEPVDSEHSRVTVNRGDDEIICDAKSATISYTAEGMVVDMKGPGTMTMKGGKPTSFSCVRVGFTNGKFTAFEFRSGPASFGR